MPRGREWSSRRGAARDATFAGGEVDIRRARGVLEKAGYPPAEILHQTGHSLGENVHGNGVHLDDYETHDDRRVLPGTGFTIEPGLYFRDFRPADRNQHVPRPERGRLP
jgi:Xaa-Pro aminopeptidase